MRLQGIPVSRGIGFGRAVCLSSPAAKSLDSIISEERIDSEVQTLLSAIDLAKVQLKNLAGLSKKKDVASASSIFDVQILMLEEKALVDKMVAAISDDKLNASSAISLVCSQYQSRQAAVDDGHLNDKAIDIVDLSDRLVKAVEKSRPKERSEIFDSIVVAREFGPSMVIEIGELGPAAMVSEHGGWTSHSAILAREFGVPMVTGLPDVEKRLCGHDLVIVDGFSGDVIIDPDLQTIEKYKNLNTEKYLQSSSESAFGTSTFTRDGTEIKIKANIDHQGNYRLARRAGAIGIGLFRSESLFERPFSSLGEDEQLAAYREIAEAASGDPVNIRTADYEFDLSIGQSDPSEKNPALGLRGIRLSLSHSDNFRAQIRALLRGAADHNINIVLPMVTGVSDVLRSKQIIEEEKDLLAAAGIEFGEPRVGVMIEVPSAVFSAAEISAEVDFLCLGTNDLVQYLLAVDRDNDAVSEWYQTLDPAVLTAIQFVLTGAEHAGVTVLLCGEMAGSPFYVPVLIGLGVREFSMNTSSIPHVRRMIAGISVDEATALTADARAFSTADQIEEVLRHYYQKHWLHLFPSGFLEKPPF